MMASIIAGIFVWVLGIAVALVLLILIGLFLFTAWTAHQVEKNIPPRGKFIDIDGVRLHYIDKGTGPVLLLIHGLAGQVLNFTHSLLGRLTRDFRVIILDRPGSGYSLRPDESLAPLTAQARIIGRFCQALGLERPVIVGHSLGGAVALALALNHPEQVGALALIAPVTHQPESVPPPFDGLAIGSPLLRRLIAWTVATPLAIANRERALTTLFGPQPISADFATRGGGLLSLRPRAFIGASTDLMAAEQDLAGMPARYQELTMPVGILYGTEDRILDPALHAQEFATKVPGTDLELIVGAGHMLLISSADQVAAFVARIAQRAAATDAPLAPVG
jgi:pimeloyl-ACP methyl ester carboxylesterase